MTTHYYTQLGGDVRGPFTLTELREQMDSGRFNLEVYEISEDRKSWRPATDIGDALKEVGRPRHRPIPVKPLAVPVAASESIGNTEAGLNAATAPAERSSEWHYTINGRQATMPASHEELERQIRAGQVGADDQIWTRGWNSWMTVRETPEFAQFLMRTASGAGGSTREMSVPAVLTAVIGGIGYVLLLVCTVMLVLRLRRSHMVASENVGVLVMTGLDLAAGIAAIVCGHLAIGAFRRIPGSLKERNVIVFGLSCGYTTLIVACLLGIAATISAASAV